MKILTWNVQWFKGLDGTVDIARVLKKAREIGDFDVLCMQEVAIHYLSLSGDTPSDQVEQVRLLLPGFEVIFSPAVDELSACGTYRQQFGNLIATRLPIKLIEKVLLPHPNLSELPNTPSMRRVCLVCTVQAPWGHVRVMTTHLEYYNHPARLAQVRAVREIHLESCALALHSPKVLPESPYQQKPHTLDALLCGDFNFEQGSVEHVTMLEPGASGSFLNAWNVLEPQSAHPATFRLFDRTYGPEPVGCDFFFVSPTLAPRVQSWVVDPITQVSDHQPVLLTLNV